jgi:8-oxo-dGTP pyrophosphatase MutT (NUDIX family)
MTANPSCQTLDRTKRTILAAHAMNTLKAVPVLLRATGAATEILAFRHPHAGLQLVKGTIDVGESAKDAALRELAEESGLQEATFTRDLGTWASGYEGQTWHFQEVQCCATAPESWEHFTQDGGGNLFHFFWHPLRLAPSPEWHPVYRAALTELCHRLGIQESSDAASAPGAA